MITETEYNYNRKLATTLLNSLKIVEKQKLKKGFKWVTLRDENNTKILTKKHS